MMIMEIRDKRKIFIFIAYFLKNIWRIQLFVVPLHRQTRGKGQWTMDDGDEAARESQVDI